MSGALETLVAGAQRGVKTLFLNGQLHSDLDMSVQVQQYFKPYVDGLECAGYNVSSDFPERELFDSVWILVPKNSVEAQYIIARGVELLADDGVLYVAADNKAGGTRLSKWMQQIGFDDVQSESRNKARLCWAIRQGDFNLDASILAGQSRRILQGRFVSQAGVFGWDKIDKGSEILVQHFSDDFKGKGADFGCGYGFISDFLLRNYPKISKLYCLDADARAIDICSENLDEFDAEKAFLWCDLTTVQPELRNLSFVVMNPPFHDGKKQDIAIGHAFIKNAHAALKRNGVLYMVANAHLPYERTLAQCFFQVEKLYEKQGFKIYKAVK